LCICFFFSSRRRHTRSKRDWSSDVCSSDLIYCENKKVSSYIRRDLYVSFSLFLSSSIRYWNWHSTLLKSVAEASKGQSLHLSGRSEERRVGKEGRCRG